MRIRCVSSILVGIIVALETLLSVSCATTPPPDMTKIYSGIANAIKASATIEVYVLQDTWNRNSHGTDGNGNSWRYTYNSLNQDVFNKATASLNNFYKKYFPNKTLTISPVSYSNADEYRQNVIQRMTGDKIVILYSLDTYEEISISVSDGQKSYSKDYYVYAGVDFFDAKNNVWLYQPGHTNDVNLALNTEVLFTNRSHGLSNSVFEIVGTADQSDSNQQQRANDEFLQNLEPNNEDIYNKLGITAGVVQVAPSSVPTPVDAEPATVSQPQLDPDIIGQWGISPAMYKASGQNVIVFIFQPDGSEYQIGAANNKYEANNGQGVLIFHNGKGAKIPFMYTIKDNVLNFDSDDAFWGAGGKHVVAYKADKDGVPITNNQ